MIETRLLAQREKNLKNAKRQKKCNYLANSIGRNAERETLRLDWRDAFVLDYFSFMHAPPFISLRAGEVQDPYTGTYIFVKIYFFARVWSRTLILMRDNTRESLPWRRNYYPLWGSRAIKTRIGDYVEILFDWMDSTHLSSILHYFFFFVSFFSFLLISSMVVFLEVFTSIRIAT